MSRYDSLNSDANLMNFYASKVDSSFKLVKDEMARLNQGGIENMSIQNRDGQVRSSGYRENPNIIKSLKIVKTKDSG